MVRRCQPAHELGRSPFPILPCAGHAVRSCRELMYGYAGRMKAWHAGRMEAWYAGRMEAWYAGRMEAWYACPPLAQDAHCSLASKLFRDKMFLMSRLQVCMALPVMDADPLAAG
eukprot:362110-Chlamydomonas_euryale.AAC.7